jgi:hypothetical protein
VDLLYFHDALHECSLRAAGVAALSGAFPPGLGARAVDALAARAAAGAVPPAQWHSLLAALLLGSMSGGGRRPPGCLARSRRSLVGAPCHGTPAAQLRGMSHAGPCCRNAARVCEPAQTLAAGCFEAQSACMTARQCGGAAWGAGVPAEASWRRHRTILDAACRALCAFGSTGTEPQYSCLHLLSRSVPS